MYWYVIVPFILSSLVSTGSVRITGQNQPTLSVKPAISLSSGDSNWLDGLLEGWTDGSSMENSAQVSPVMIRVETPDQSTRGAVDVVCIVDVSGSMSSLAEYDDDAGGKKNDGLSILDLVKHAVNTVAHTLGNDDRLSIVSFDSSAQVELPLTPMTANGLNSVNTTLKAMYTRGSTNMKDGIRVGMNLLAAPSGVAPRKKIAMLLTDGMPDSSSGHVEQVRSFMDKHPGFRFQLNTFGFGYSLKSDLLLDLAIEGGGTFSFIPDGLIVGTTFVNSIANTLATQMQSAKLHLMPVGGAKFVGPVRGNYEVSKESWGHVVALGPVQAGQPRDIVVPMEIPVGFAPYLEVVLEYSDPDGSSHKMTHLGSDRSQSAQAVVAALRSRTIEVGIAATKQSSIDGVATAGQTVSKLAKAINEVLDKDDSSELLQAIKYDVEGRMSKALRGKPRFDRWGKHYLRALMRAHQLQLCTNFMDPGLQTYGGSLFREEKSKGDKAFLALPDPVPSGSSSSSSSSSVSMSNYYQGGGGGCFGDSSTVILEMANRSTKQVRVNEVRKGDRIRVSGGGTAVVECVVQIARAMNKPLVQLPNGPSITGGHPVRMAGEWRLPRNIAPSALIKHNGSVYNFILDQNHVAVVDDVECVTWGHGLTDPVVAHAFFGTGSILKELKSSTGWKRGHVVVEGFFRDPATGEAAGLKTTDQTHLIDI